MIPKIIHYCWFGGNPLPKLAVKCIASWKKYFPDYEIKEWNEYNFDLSSCNYIKEAYKLKKWAFVSDYVRFKVLYQYGGLYFDTDVEIIKDMSEIIKSGPFMGTEKTGIVAPGLGLAANPGLGLYKEILDFYEVTHFILPDGTINNQTVVNYITNILLKHKYKGKYEIEEICGIKIYPPEYFCPKNYNTGEINITHNTYSIHYYTASWHSFLHKLIINIERCKNINSIEFKIRRIISLPFRIISRINKTGVVNTIIFVINKIRNDK